MKRASRHHLAFRQAGFTLLSVLVAIFIFGIGILAMARSMVGLTSAATQNESISSMAGISNAFWGVVQSEPSMLTNSAFAPASFTSSTITTAPAALQPWLTSTTSTLPGSTVSIVTYADAAGNNSTCSSSTGCTVMLTLQWTPPGTPGQSGSSTRSQTFYYQFGL